MSDPKELSAENLGSGAVSENLNHCIQQVLDNIEDPNTKATLKREITLKIKIQPDEDREVFNVEYEVVPKLAPRKSLTSTWHSSKQVDGKNKAVEISKYNPTKPIPGLDENLDILDKDNNLTDFSELSKNRMMKG